MALPSFDPAELDAYLTSSITLIDLADEDLEVGVSMVDPTTQESVDLGTYAVQPLGQIANQLPPGTYHLVFHQPPGSGSGSTCTIQVTDADGWIFAAVPGAIAVSRSGGKPARAADLFVASSKLCGNRD